MHALAAAATAAPAGGHAGLRSRVTARTTRCSPRCTAHASATHAASRRDVLLSASAAALVLGCGPALAAAAPGVGDQAPAFAALPSTSGKDISLADLTSSGKWTVLYFYNADFSSGCSLEAQRFQQALPSFLAAGAQVVGVSMDDLSKHSEFCSDKKLTFPLLSDSTGDMSSSYGADLKIPIFGRFSDRQTFLIDPKGTIRGKWKEADGSMASVKTPEHTLQVLATLMEATAGLKV